MIKVLRACLVLAMAVSMQAFSGGLEPEKTDSPSPKPTMEPVKTIQAIPVEPIITATPARSDDCKPRGGNQVTNHGAVTNGGDSVNTKVVCQCETSKSCEDKVKYVDREVVKWKTKTVEKKVPGPVKYVDRTVETPAKTVYVDKPVEKIVYVNKECPGCTNNKNWSLGMLMGEGPSGVHVYKYGNEYRAREGGGILMGIDLSYRFMEHWNVGGLYINNDTKMFRVGFNF